MEGPLDANDREVLLAVNAVISFNVIYIRGLNEYTLYINHSHTIISQLPSDFIQIYVV